MLLSLGSSRSINLRVGWRAYIRDGVNERTHARWDGLVIGGGCGEEHHDGAVSQSEMSKDLGV